MTSQPRVTREGLRTARLEDESTVQTGSYEGSDKSVMIKPWEPRADVEKSVSIKVWAPEKAWAIRPSAVPGDAASDFTSSSTDIEGRPPARRGSRSSARSQRQSAEDLSQSSGTGPSGSSAGSTSSRSPAERRSLHFSEVPTEVTVPWGNALDVEHSPGTPLRPCVGGVGGTFQGASRKAFGQELAQAISEEQTESTESTATRSSGRSSDHQVLEASAVERRPSLNFSEVPTEVTVPWGSAIDREHSPGSVGGVGGTFQGASRKAFGQERAPVISEEPTESTESTTTRSSGRSSDHQVLEASAVERRRSVGSGNADAKVAGAPGKSSAAPSSSKRVSFATEGDNRSTPGGSTATEGAVSRRCADEAPSPPRLRLVGGRICSAGATSDDAQNGAACEAPSSKVATEIRTRCVVVNTRNIEQMTSLRWDFYEEGGAWVHELDRGFPADQHLCVGDRLLKINQVDVSKLMKAEVKKVWSAQQKEGRYMALTFQAMS